MNQSQNDPVLAELWEENCALISEAAAAKFGIADGDEVFVESATAKVKMKAKLTKGLRDDCVSIDHGYGHWSEALSVAKGKGASSSDLIPSRTIEEQLKYNTPDMAAYMSEVALKVYKA